MDPYRTSAKLSCPDCERRLREAYEHVFSTGNLTYNYGKRAPVPMSTKDVFESIVLILLSALPYVSCVWYLTAR